MVRPFALFTLGLAVVLFVPAVNAGGPFSEHGSILLPTFGAGPALLEAERTSEENGSPFPSVAPHLYYVAFQPPQGAAYSIVADDGGEPFEAHFDCGGGLARAPLAGTSPCDGTLYVFLAFGDPGESFTYTEG